MNQTVKLNTGAPMPAIGFGTWQLTNGDETRNAVERALHIGYRLIDTARIYHNEQSIGEAIKDSGIERKDIFVTTKLWKADHGYDAALRAFNESLSKLGLEYIDLYLIHWPGDDIGLRNDSWRALIDVHTSGKAWAIGVSNYDVSQLEELTGTSIVPAVNQIEFHPFVYERQKPILEYCKSQGIVVQAYSPLAQARSLDHTVIQSIAQKTGKTPAQVLLRWAIQHGTVPLPKSANPERMQENIEVFDFELSEEAMQALNALSTNGGSTFS